jgi:hypothetical protein
MAFYVTDVIGMQAIAETSATQQHPLGATVKAIDSTLGPGEFVYGKGVANTAAGDACIIYADGTTARAVHTTAAIGRLGIAMSALIDNLYGWYQVWGKATITQSASTIGTSGGPLYLTSTAGVLDDTAVKGDQVIGMNSSGTTRTAALLSYPFVGVVDAQS